MTVIFTRTEIETALDAGRLHLAMVNGRWWRARRNGKTQTWKTRPDDYRIPVKAGLRVYDAITPQNATSTYYKVV